MAKQALGRGLGALMGGVPANAKPASPSPAPAAATVHPAASNNHVSGEQVHRLPVNKIHPCAFQPRKDFAEEPLNELAQSIREQGILQPLVVRPRNGSYEIIAGERRWRAAQLAGLTEVPALVREADDRKVLELALIENLQRENLNPIEEALGFSRLIQEFQLKQEDAAVRVGKSRTTITNLLRLLQLQPEVQAYVRSGLLSSGHAKAILGCAVEAQKPVADQVIREGLSVRETESLVADRTAVQGKKDAPKHPQAGEKPDVHVADVQTKLQERFGTRVFVRYRKGKGAVDIRFGDDMELSRILDIIGIKID